MLEKIFSHFTDLPRVTGTTEPVHDYRVAIQNSEYPLLHEEYADPTFNEDKHKGYKLLPIKYTLHLDTLFHVRSDHELGQFDAPDKPQLIQSV